VSQKNVWRAVAEAFHTGGGDVRNRAAEMDDGLRGGSGGGGGGSGSGGYSVAASPLREKRGSTIVTSSVSAQFRTQLDELMRVVGATRPHYVRCLKVCSSRVRLVNRACLAAEFSP